MAIKFEHDGTVFEVDTPEQAVTLLELLKGRTTAVTTSQSSQEAASTTDWPLDEPEALPIVWDLPLFSRFIRRLGEPQKLILEYLVVRGESADWELRHLIGVWDNQALAGALSGIAKQALAEKIQPRAVFLFQNYRSGGKRSSRYGLTESFLAFARCVEWPSPSELHRERYPAVDIVDKQS